MPSFSECVKKKGPVLFLILIAIVITLVLIFARCATWLVAVLCVTLGVILIVLTCICCPSCAEALDRRRHEYWIRCLECLSGGRRGSQAEGPGEADPLVPPQSPRRPLADLDDNRRPSFFTESSNSDSRALIDLLGYGSTENPQDLVQQPQQQDDEDLSPNPEDNWVLPPPNGTGQPDNVSLPKTYDEADMEPPYGPEWDDAALARAPAHVPRRKSPRRRDPCSCQQDQPDGLIPSSQYQPVRQDELQITILPRPQEYEDYVILPLGPQPVEQDNSPVSPIVIQQMPHDDVVPLLLPQPGQHDDSPKSPMHQPEQQVGSPKSPMHQPGPQVGSPISLIVQIGTGSDSDVSPILPPEQAGGEAAQQAAANDTKEKATVLYLSSNKRSPLAMMHKYGAEHPPDFDPTKDEGLRIPVVIEQAEDVTSSDQSSDPSPRFKEGEEEDLFKFSDEKDDSSDTVTEADEERDEDF